MLQEEYDSILYEINRLEEQRQHYEEELKFAKEEDDIIECKYQIMKIQEELSPLYAKESNLLDELDELNKKQKKDKIREKTYKKFYVTLDMETLLNLKKYFKVNGNSKEEILTSIFDKYPNSNPDYKITTAIENINKINKYSIDEVLKKINADGGYLKNDNINSVYNKLETKTRLSVKYIEKEYELILLGIAGGPYNFNFEFLDWKERRLSEFDDDYLDEHPLNSELLPDEHIVDNFHFYICFRNDVGDDVLEMFSLTEKIKEYDALKKERHKKTLEWLKQRKLEEIEKQNRLNKLSEDLKKKKEKKPKIPNCYNKLNENSSLEDIANCYCECNEFNNWKFDEKNKKIIFELLRADGKNIIKMKKIEVKKLKKWVKNYETDLR